MDIRDTTSRLRRTFHYPTDDSSNSATPEVLDEEEQDNLIQTLAEQNATTNQQYQSLLLALPILSSIPYILALFRPATFLIALLGLSSLASTAYLLLSLPATETGIPLLDAWARAAAENSSSITTTTTTTRARARPSGSAFSGGDDDDDNDYDDQDGENIINNSSRSALGGWWSGTPSTTRGGPSGLGTLDQRRRRRRRSRANSLPYEVPRSPLEKHLPFLNMGLCAILVLYGLSAARGEISDGGGGGGGGGGHQHHHNFGWLGLGNLPAIVYVVVIIAKVVMASVDPERELAALKYGYKGA